MLMYNGNKDIQYNYNKIQDFNDSKDQIQIKASINCMYASMWTCLYLYRMINGKVSGTWLTVVLDKMLKETFRKEHDYWTRAARTNPVPDCTSYTCLKCVTEDSHTQW